MATVYRLLDVGRQFLDDNGDPYAGGLLFTYTAGSSTKKTTYQEASGSTPHANPIVLDASGRLPAPVWGTTGAYKLVLAPSTDTDPPASPEWTEDDVSGINDTATSSVDQWVASGVTPTYVSATSFTLVGDQTTEFHVGRRLKSTNSGGTRYSRITASSYSAPSTTVTVVNDSGNLDTGLSAVSYGILSSSNHSMPIIPLASKLGYPALDMIASGTASSVSSLAFTDLSANYRQYILAFDDLAPSGDNVTLNLRVSTDNGSTYKVGASDYAWAYTVNNEAGAVSDDGDADDSEITLQSAIGSTAGETVSGQITVDNPMGSGKTRARWHIGLTSATPTYGNCTGSGEYQTAGATNAFAVFFASANIATMNYTLYGVRA